jgi:hypothetical protein
VIHASRMLLRHFSFRVSSPHKKSLKSIVAIVPGSEILAETFVFGNSRIAASTIVTVDILSNKGIKTGR